MGQPLGHDLMGGHAAQILTEELDGAGLGPQQAGHGLQNGAFACAVCADEGDDLALMHLEGHALDGVDAAVIDVDVIDF